MLSIELIEENLKRSEELALARIRDMRGHCMVPSTPGGGAHTLWVLGHLAYIEALVIRQFMRGESSPLADWESIFDGDSVSDDPQEFPDFDRVLEECRAARASTLVLLDTLAEDDLDRVSAATPEAAQELFGTWRSCFQYAADHWYMHRGQLAGARRAAGIERMWY